MSDVLRATYSDLKTVKTRGAVQLILEMPIEALTEVVGLLGAPVPGETVWVAVARLRDTPQIEAEPSNVIPTEQRPLSQVAATLGSKQFFRRFLTEKSGREIIGPEEAAIAVRELCGVTTRKAFDTDTEAARRFRDLNADYQNWKRGAAA